MPTFESSLAAPVMRWLESRGFTCYGEVFWFGRAIDIVAISDESIEVVELKLSLTATVIRQANIALTAAHRAWCAVGTRPATLASRIESGWLKSVGVLGVSGDSINVLHEAPQPSRQPGQRYLDGLRNACSLMEPGGAAGLATNRGVGPAQSVYDRIEAFRAANPKARWADVFVRVPNHYAHPRSMQSAMRVVSERRAKQRLRRESDAAKLKAAKPEEPTQ